MAERKMNLVQLQNWSQISMCMGKMMRGNAHQNDSGSGDSQAFRKRAQGENEITSQRSGQEPMQGEFPW